jgi:hypothetical protein
MHGNKPRVKYDSGLEFGKLLDRTIHRNARFELQMGWISADERLGLLTSFENPLDN